MIDKLPLKCVRKIAVKGAPMRDHRPRFGRASKYHASAANYTYEVMVDLWKDARKGRTILRSDTHLDLIRDVTKAPRGREPKIDPDRTLCEEGRLTWDGQLAWVVGLARQAFKPHDEKWNDSVAHHNHLLRDELVMMEPDLGTRPHGSTVPERLSSPGEKEKIISITEDATRERIGTIDFAFGRFVLAFRADLMRRALDESAERPSCCLLVAYVPAPGFTNWV